MTRDGFAFLGVCAHIAERGVGHADVEYEVDAVRAGKAEAEGIVADDIFIAPGKRHARVGVREDKQKKAIFGVSHSSRWGRKYIS